MPSKSTPPAIAMPKPVLKPIDFFKPHPRNARTHSPQQVEQLVTAIKTFGWTDPMQALASGTIVAGHGRLQAARIIGLKRLPCVIVGEGWDELKTRAAVISDNQLALNAGWDMKTLTADLAELKAADLLTFTGFSLQEFESLSIKPTESRKKNDGSSFIPSAYDVIVSCAGELSQRQLLEKLTAEGFKCKALVR